MIINKLDKSLQTREDKPNENWTDNKDVYVVDDNSELAQRIINAYPYYDFVVEDGELVDIIELEKPPQPEPEPTEIELLQQENQQIRSDLDSAIMELSIAMAMQGGNQ